jgi:hypothetical protein
MFTITDNRVLFLRRKKTRRRVEAAAAVTETASSCVKVKENGTGVSYHRTKEQSMQCAVFNHNRGRWDEI